MDNHRSPNGDSGPSGSAPSSDIAKGLDADPSPIPGSIPGSNVNPSPSSESETQEAGSDALFSSDSSEPRTQPSNDPDRPLRAPLSSPPVRPNAKRLWPQPSSEPRSASRLSGWPLAFLLLGLAIVGSCHYSALNLADVMDSGFQSLYDTVSQPSVGVLAVEGEIVSSLWAVRTLKRFQDNEKIMAVIIRLDTPGGAVAPCQEIVETIRGMTKPVVVSMGTVAASGGVYLAMAGDHIMANPGTLTGSIGVIMETFAVHEVIDKFGVKTDVFTSGQFKDIGSPLREMRPEEKVLIQSLVMEVYEQFVAEVVKGRPNLKEEQIRLLADGRIFTGQEAKKVGLVDEIGGFDKAVEKAVTLAKGSYDPKEEIQIIYEDGKGGLLDKLLSLSQNFLKPSSLLPASGLKYLYRPGL